MLDSAFSCAFVGTQSMVKDALNGFITRHRPDEVMVTSNIFDHAARLKSYTLLSQA